MSIERLRGRLTKTLTAAALLVAMGGCSGSGSGSGSPAGTAAANPDNPGTAVAQPAATSAAGTSACVLVTEPDASTALGTASGPGATTTLGRGGSQCAYVISDGALTVTVTPGQIRSSLDQLHPGTGTWNDVSGVGTAAFEFHDGTSSSLFFLKDTTLVSILLTRGAAPAPTAAAITVARSAAGRI
jgi:hypothetical protein